MFTHNIYRNVRTRVIILRNGRMLLFPPLPDGSGRDPYRCLPGGGLEPNESLYECGQREVLEETGLQVRVRSVAFLREWVIPKMVSLEEMRAEVEAWGFEQEKGPCPGHAYGLEAYLWAELSPSASADPRPDDIRGATAEWVTLEQIEHEPLFPSELRALARDLLEGRRPVGVPSFITGLGTPYDKPDYQAFRRLQDTEGRP